MKTAALSLGLVLACSVLAQESTSYKLTEHSFNAGGHPSDGVVLSSSSYQITIDAIGDDVISAGLLSTSYAMDGGIGSAYIPPGEVLGLSFTSAQTMVWDPEESAGAYNLYRDSLSTLTSLDYGGCEQQYLTTASATDNDPLSAGDGFFYLVTVENRLGEEGTKGVDSSDVTREGTVCP